MFSDNGSSTLTNCLFTDNSAINTGGGIASYDSSSIVTHCRFTGNSAHRGGGMYFEASNTTVVNCSFSGNTTNSTGGGMLINGANNPTVINCIFWGDLPNEIQNDSGTPTFTFCDVEGGLPVGAIDGGGNISEDPLFVDADGVDNIFGTDDDDLRLQPGSPAIDAADSTLLMAENITSDLDGNLRFVNFGGKTDTGVGPVTFLGPITFLDMGPYETQFDCIIPGDINCDGIVNLFDLAIMGNNWLVSVIL